MAITTGILKAPTDLDGVLLFEKPLFSDKRGRFAEIMRSAELLAAGIEEPFVQANHSHSRRGVLRGLHYQRLHPQGKLITVVSGVIHDVVVDIRLGSPTFAAVAAVELSDEGGQRLYVPPGLAHGFCALSEGADVVYFCTDYYRPDDEHGIIWSDRDLAIDWPVESPILSPRDSVLPELTEIPEDELPLYRASRTPDARSS